MEDDHDINLLPVLICVCTQRLQGFLYIQYRNRMQRASTLLRCEVELLNRAIHLWIRIKKAVIYLTIYDKN